MLSIELAGEHLKLLPERCVFWPKAGMLILADVHLGKAGHFRKAGIPIPAQVHLEDLQRISRALSLTGAGQLLILGDLFHSHYNQEWQALEDWKTGFPDLEVSLVEGNHDRYSLKHMPQWLVPRSGQYRHGPFLFTHEPSAQVPDGLYNLCGHLHPGVVMRGGGLQLTTLPCFYFATRQGILPAFGKFTGLAKIRVYPEDRVYVLAGSKVVSVS